MSAVNLYRTLSSRYFSSFKTYIILKSIDITAFILADEIFNTGYIIYLILIVLSVASVFAWGGRSGYFLLGFSFVMYVMVDYIYWTAMSMSGYRLSFKDIMVLLLYIIIGLFCARFAEKLFNDRLDSERKNTMLVEQLKQKNLELEQINRKLQHSVAELYTLQQISNALSSIYNMQELLKCVNDIILGVMGTNYSTILLYDDAKERLKLHITNLHGKEEIARLSDRINCSVLMDVLKKDSPLIENNVSTDKYPFTEGRDVKSLICVPFGYKAKMFGLILTENKNENSFNEDNLRLLLIIGQQVGMAVENAGLYLQMEELANTDSLTGLYNRLYFQNRLSQELKLAQENKFPLSVAILDIDNFKRFNDTYGHLFGDKVLKKLSELMRSSLRATDVIARFGGEEFIILFIRTGLKDAYKKAEKLRGKISSMTVTDMDASASVTVSFGVSSYPECALNENDLLRSADNALYEAKTAGRNCVRASKSCGS